LGDARQEVEQRSLARADLDDELTGRDGGAAHGRNECGQGVDHGDGVAGTGGLRGQRLAQSLKSEPPADGEK
jgi:hypothetical protein